MRYGYIAAPCAAAAAGFLVGAAFMYVFDPDSGKRRRAVARDKTLKAANDAMEGVKSTAQDLSNRAYGMAAEAKGMVTGNRSSGGDGSGEPRLPNKPF